MHHIKLTTQVTRADLRQLDQAAADCGESLDTSNVFLHGTDNHRNFRSDFRQRQSALEAVA